MDQKRSTSSANLGPPSWQPADQLLFRFATEHSSGQQVAARPPTGRTAAGAASFQLPAGRPVNYYPASRQPSRPSSPGRPPTQWFHVPSGPAAGSPGRLPRSFGFVAPADRVRPSTWTPAFKSRTIAHLPDMVALSTDPPEAAPEVADYEHFYERGPRCAEPDLLRAHRVSVAGEPSSRDNPFRPGTELSWEADLMVRLMRRGYPLDELVRLVESAKQVAGGVAPPEPSRRASAGRAATLGHPPAAKRPAELDPEHKRVWASSLSRARSVPRGLSLGATPKTAQKPTTDSDSIDRLISSIETEMERIQLDSAAARGKPANRKLDDARLQLEPSLPLTRRKADVRPDKQAAPANSRRRAKDRRPCCKVH